MIRNRLPLLLLLGVAVARVFAQAPPPVDPRINFKVSLANTQREFHIGETIPLQLSFSSTVKERYQINVAQGDRSGRMHYEHFVMSPAQGTVDPLPSLIGNMGGLTSHMYLSPEPWTITLNLNEWVRFTQPGEYRLRINSDRVVIKDPSSQFGVSPVTARSNEITLKIVAADPVWQKQVLRDAVAILDKAAQTKPGEVDQQLATLRRAMETLRFLGTADAAREMAKRMRGEGFKELDYICSLGLRSTPERAAARSALDDALADPDHPINSTFLYALSVVDADPDATNSNWSEDNQRALEKLIAALNTKRAKALSISLSTALNGAWNSATLPKETTDRLAGLLISMFDQLPVNEQNALLSYRWDKVASAAMLPLVKRYALAYRDVSEMRGQLDAYAVRELSGVALKRWYELDPAGARPAFINEISRPRPRFNARLLGMLPDKTLPEVDFTLAQNLAAKDDEGLTSLASLIARYATVAIAPQVVEQLDPKIGKWACDIQDPLLAYLLRVDPALARPRIERAIAARGEGFSACNHALFQSIAAIHYDPLLEELAIKSLDDPDPEVAANAATMLGKFSSPAAESALLQRYTSWTAKWAGRESELDLIFSDLVNEKFHQLGLGQNLMRALATGKSWLSDKNKLQRLSQMTKARSVQRELDTFLNNWQDETLTIYIGDASSPARFSARLAQYEFQSLEALKEKVSLFPAGTKFILTVQPQEPPADEQTMTELRAFLAAKAKSE